MNPDAAHDLEQEQLLEQQPPTQIVGSWRKRTALLVAAGVALLGAVTLGLSFTKPAAVLGLNDLHGLIQDYATQRGSRPLTDAEVEAVKDQLGNMDQQRSMLRLANSTLGRDLDLRSLRSCNYCRRCDCDDDDDNDDDGSNSGGDSGSLGTVSRKCRKALRKSVKRSLRRMAHLAVDHFLDCVLGSRRSDACKGTQRRVDDLDAQMKRRCRRSGDVCSVVETHCAANGALVKDSEEFCMPKECHDELNVAMDLVTQLLRDEEFKDAVASGHGVEHAKGYDNSSSAERRVRWERQKQPAGTGSKGATWALPESQIINPSLCSARWQRGWLQEPQPGRAALLLPVEQET
eukprot:CAMPEP_0171059456 /NCGR_PEP_ID=MMETSP0766_2-20121228/3183_1 /TAXON_ID=439317 /ORGANISM="Gambierdiscus australes, Strain CAWD 149" /LENGTH=346 /DNA_ID=CAMNT_0011514893 /DNA_START=52 /DNA_END=1093 /DNA_ORIENTATION=-